MDGSSKHKVAPESYQYLNQDLNLVLLITTLGSVFINISEISWLTQSLHTNNDETSGPKNVFVFRETLLSSMCQRFS